MYIKCFNRPFIPFCFLTTGAMVLIGCFLHFAWMIPHMQTGWPRSGYDKICFSPAIFHYKIWKWHPLTLTSTLSSISLHMKFHMSNPRTWNKCVVKKHEHDESVWKDAQQSDARKNGDWQVNEGEIYYKILDLLGNLDNSPCSLFSRLEKNIPKFPVPWPTLSNTHVKLCSN